MLRPTAEITRDPGLAALIDELAGAAFDGPAFGYAATPTEGWTRYEELVKAAPAELWVALLAHEAFTVRAYAGTHVARALPEHARALAEVVLDTHRVWQRNGCLSAPTSLSEDILEGLERHLDHPEVQALLLGVAADPARGEVGARCLSMAARARPEEALARAEAWLAAEIGDDLRARVIHAVGAAGGEAAVDRIAPETRHASPTVRRAVALALVGHTSPRAIELAMALLADPDRAVVAAAAQAYATHPDRDGDRAREIIDREGLARELIRVGHPTPEALEVFAREVLADPANGRPISDLLSIRPIREEVAEVVRRIAAARPPEGSSSAGARAEAIVYLSEVAEARDLPEMRRSLATSCNREWEYATKTIVKLGDREAIPLLVEKLASEHAYTRLVAAEVLLALGAHEAEGAVARAAEGIEPGVGARLAEIAAKLRPPPEPSFVERVWGFLGGGTRDRDPA